MCTGLHPVRANTRASVAGMLGMWAVASVFLGSKAQLHPGLLWDLTVLPSSLLENENNDCDRLSWFVRGYYKLMHSSVLEHGWHRVGAEWMCLYTRGCWARPGVTPL